MYTVDIITLKDFTLAALDHKGDYMEIGSVFEKLFASAVQQGVFTQETRVWGMYYDDPKTVAKEDLRSKAGVTVSKGTVLKDGISLTPIAGGKFAKVLYKGPYNELDIPYNWIYGTWLPQSGHESKDLPVIEEYLNNPNDTDSKDLLTAIHIPLKG